MGGQEPTKPGGQSHSSSPVSAQSCEPLDLSPHLGETRWPLGRGGKAGSTQAGSCFWAVEAVGMLVSVCPLLGVRTPPACLHVILKELSGPRSDLSGMPHLASSR